MELFQEENDLQTQAEKLLDLYTNKDNEREDLKEPFMPLSTHVTSTNGIDGVFIPIEHIALRCLAQYSLAPKIDRFFSAVPFNPATGNPVQTNCSFIVTKEEILNALSHVPQIEDTDEVSVDCTNCNGTGEEECDMGHKHDCTECYGTSKTLEDRPNGKMILDTSKAVLCSGVRIGVIRLQNLLSVMEISGKDSCIHILANQNGCNFFDFGKFIVYAMPMRNPGEGESPESIQSVSVNIAYEMK